MKVSMDKEALSHVLDVVSGLVPNRSSLPILTNVLLEASPETGVRLTATDLDVSVALAGSANVFAGGAMAVPAKLFAEIVRSAPSGEIMLTAKENQVEITSPGRSFRVMVMDAAEFPRVPPHEGEGALELPIAVLPDLVERTIYAVSRDETRPALNGVLWEIGARELRMVATDGHRLARYRVEGKYPVTAERQVIVPPKSLQQLVRLIKEAEEGVALRVELSENHIRWRLGESVLFSKLIEGPFPKYEQVIPKEHDKRLVVNRLRFLEDVRAIDTVADSMTRMVRLAMRTGEVKLSTRTQDVGEGEIACEDTLYEGEPLTVGYNAGYVIDALGHMTSERVELLLKTQVGPGLFKEINPPAPGEYLSLVMPLRLSD